MIPRTYLHDLLNCIFLNDVHSSGITFVLPLKIKRRNQNSTYLVAKSLLNKKNCGGKITIEILTISEIHYYIYRG